jgi:hypothetical protein
MIRFLTSLLLVVFLLTGFSFLDKDVVLEVFKASQEGGYVRVTWVSEKEQNVLEYKLYRRAPWTGSNEEVEIQDQEFPAKRSGATYTYIDQNVYKQGSADNLHYSLWVVKTDGSREKLGEASATYISTAVRRTWGSIKAMFQ